MRNTDSIVETTQNFNWTNDAINVLGIDIRGNPKEMLEQNYKCILSKVNNITSDWGNRGLSLIGRTIMLTSLVGSLFVYKMNVLPNMPKNLLRSQLLAKYGMVKVPKSALIC